VVVCLLSRLWRNLLNNRANGNAVRRRRSWYRRRLRVQRALAVFAVVALSALFGWLSATYIFPSQSGAVSRALPESLWANATKHDLGFVSPQSSKRPVYVARVPNVYPYSVVPGGLKSAQALRQAAANDRAVARHFAQFDYSRAHLVRLTEPRTVYVSYRIRDTVFWTQKRIHLQAGELLLTDGKITARAKCGNQVSDTAKPEISQEEPEEDVLDQPVALEPIGPSLPFRAVLGAPDLPSGQPVSPKMFAGSLGFPYVPFNLPLPPKNCAFESDQGKNCPPIHKKQLTPEPSTMVLLGSGLLSLGWFCRKKRGVRGV